MENEVLWWEKFLREEKKFFRVYKGPLLGKKNSSSQKKGRQKYLDFDIQKE